MDLVTEQKVYDLLETMGEALSQLQYGGKQETLCQLISAGRRQLTAAFDREFTDSLDVRVDASALSDEDWLRTAYWIMGEITEPFQPENAYDRAFQELLQYIWSHTGQELLQAMINRVEYLKEQSEQDYRNFVEYFSRFPLWGTLDPDQGNYTTLERRAAVLKQHSYDFLWLYRRLEDYLSRRSLYAILRNWAVLDFSELQTIKSIFSDYWEPDIFPDNKDDILVDVGAYTGDSIEQYVRMYGSGYKRIYAYEISEDSYSKLCQKIAGLGWHDVVARRKGAGRTRDEMFIKSNNADASANQLGNNASAGACVEVVPLDEDIKEAITFLKMDIEGAEQDALLGCEKMIRENHPKLAICTYHGYEDIWKIPLIIDSFNPDYKFYLRHYGGNLIPTEFVLLCKPQNNC